MTLTSNERLKVEQMRQLNGEAKAMKLQRRYERYHRYERLVRRLRQRIFGYEDAGKGDKAVRILRKAISIKCALAPPPPTNEWGYTPADLRALHRNGMAMPD